MLRQVGGFTATRFRDPGGRQKMRQNFETTPDEENSRSAVLLRFPCAQSRADITAWLSKEIPESEK